MTALTETHSLGELAAGANREHLACEQAYGSAIEHAFRAGEYLLAAKSEVGHGDWLPWLAENFLASERMAQRYMQIVREIGDPTRVSDLPVREVLADLTVPRPAAPAPEPKPSIFDVLRAEGGLEHAKGELVEEDARREVEGFPRTGVERKTFRDIRDRIAAADRSLDLSKSQGFSAWSRAEALVAASKKLREASELAAELASLVRHG